jgi:hypothetical protein
MKLNKARQKGAVPPGRFGVEPVMRASILTHRRTVVLWNNRNLKFCKSAIHVYMQSNANFRVTAITQGSDVPDIDLKKSSLKSVETEKKEETVAFRCTCSLVANSHSSEHWQ